MSEAARLQKIDIARGLALLGMGVCHFSWDLSYFGYLPAGAGQSGALYVLARFVAGSFLFLAGFSLFLSQGQGFRGRAFCRRLALLAACAALVSAASYIFLPQDFIYFGILHELALAAVLGLPLLRAPLSLNCALIAACICAPPLAAALGADLRAPQLWWLGLSQHPAPSVDYAPLFPWFACALAGQSCAALMARHNWLAVLRGGLRPQALNRALQFCGRRSLPLYLLHQPFFLAGLWLYAQILPPGFSAERAELALPCVKTCSLQHEAAACRRFCACAASALAAQNLLRPYLTGEVRLSAEEGSALRRRCARVLPETKSR